MDRYQRLVDIIPMDIVRNTLAIVGGCGALGNEVIKQLALLGVGHIVICDHDKVEIHNLTRSVLFRREDAGRPKAEVAAEMVREINPDVNVMAFPHNIAELGAGFFRRADMIFSTFDAEFPRLFVNETCMRLGKAWIDGGMSALDHKSGQVTVYDGSDPDAYCYACRKDPRDVVQRVKAVRGPGGCTGHENMMGVIGGVPTTPMMSSVIGGIQVSAALEVLLTKRLSRDKSRWFTCQWSLNVSTMTARRITIKRQDECYHHNMVRYIGDRIIEKKHWRSDRTTYREILEEVQEELGSKDVVISHDEDLYTVGACPQCGRLTEYFMHESTAALADKKIPCPHCSFEKLNFLGSIVADIYDDWEFGDRPLQEVGGRPLDILKVIRTSDETWSEYYYEVTGDAEIYGLESGSVTDMAGSGVEAGPGEDG